MEITGKIGTYSMGKLHVFRKRNPPKIGDRITVSSIPANKIRARCIVVAIEDLGNGTMLYRLDRLQSVTDASPSTDNDPVRNVPKSSE